MDQPGCAYNFGGKVMEIAMKISTTSRKPLDNKQCLHIPCAPIVALNGHLDVSKVEGLGTPQMLRNDRLSTEIAMEIGRTSRN